MGLFSKKEKKEDNQKELYASLGYLFHVSASRNRRLRRSFMNEPLANDINAVLIALDNIQDKPVKKIKF